MKIESRISGFTRAAHLCRRHASAVLWVTMAALFPTACSDDTKQPTPQTDGHTAVIYLNFKTGGSSKQTAETRAPMTRATPLEDDIRTVDVLSFKVDPTDPTNMKKGTFFYRAQGTYDASTQTVRVRLMGASENQTLVVLANSRKQVNALGTAYGEARAQVMKRLKFHAGPDHRVTLTPADGTPMWGELPNQTINDSYAQTLATAPTVNLVRMIAKITIEAGVEHVKACHLYHGYAAGQIVPDNAGGNVTVDPADAAPAAPAYADYTSDFPFMGGTSFYVFESNNRQKAAADKMKNTFLTIQVTNFQAGQYWYRVDLKNYTTGEYYDILRNHEYKIELAGPGGTIDAPHGADTEEKAMKGVNNFKCRIVPWNEVQEKVEVEGTKRLTVDKRKVEIPLSEMLTGGKLTITTENTGGWTISNATLGITFSKSAATADGTETITIRTIPRKGSFRLKAGNAEMEIKVKREAVPLDYVAEFNLAGGFQYGASFNSSNPSGATPNSAQTDAALRWATGHSNDQSGYYNWYVLKGITESTYNPSGKNLFSDSFFTTGAGKGYHLPSRWELTGVFSYSGQAYYGSSTNQSVNEAVEFGGIKNTFASDYFSSGNGVCYALRFKQGTDSPNDGSSLTDFPKATDNSMLCAYRYTRVGSFNNDNNLDSRIKVDCVYLGESGASMPISTISNDAWWTSHASQTTTRIFPAAGYIWPAAVSGSGTLYNRGSNGYYWSGTESNGSNAWLAYFFSGYAYTFDGNSKNGGFPVRLFASE